MKRFTFLFSILVASSFAYGEEVCESPIAGINLDDIAGTAEVATKDCSNKNLNHEETCKCLEDAKFLDLKVSRKDKNNFHQFEFDKAIREKLAHAVRDQISNFTKFSNLLKTKEHMGNLVDKSEPVCNIQTIAQQIESISKKAGSSECPSPKGFMPNRLKDIFGTTNPKEIPEKLKFEANGLKDNSCISTQLYLDLRSNSGAAAKGFRDLISNKDKIKDKIKSSEESEQEAYKDLLSYDVLFNLAYRDETFKEKLTVRLNSLKGEGKRTFEIYNDQETLKEAWKSLNRSCNDLMKNVTGFLCANDHPKLPADIAQAHLDDYLSKKKLPEDEKKALNDYLTKKYSCTRNNVPNLSRIPVSRRKAFRDDGIISPYSWQVSST